MDAHARQVEHQELLVGILAREIVNHSFHPPKQAKCAADFMPCRSTARPATARRVNRKQVADDIRGWAERARANGQVITSTDG